MARHRCIRRASAASRAKRKRQRVETNACIFLPESVEYAGTESSTPRWLLLGTAVTEFRLGEKIACRGYGGAAIFFRRLPLSHCKAICGQASRKPQTRT